jgi:hypothetical protein
VKHFSAEHWIDFARGNSGEGVRDEMEKHLASGCEECRRTLEFWTLTTRTARRAAEHQPPESLVGSMKGLGALAGLPMPRSPLAVVAQLVLDSFGGATAMGFRSGRQSPRVLLYRSGRTFVDLRIEDMQGSSRVCVVGQVLDSSGLTKAVAGVRVLAASGPDKVQEVVTNRFGEFQLELESTAGMHISVHVDGDKQILLPLDQKSDKLQNTIGY